MVGANTHRLEVPSLSPLQLRVSHCLCLMQGWAGGTCPKQKGAATGQETYVFPLEQTLGAVGAPDCRRDRSRDQSQFEEGFRSQEVLEQSSGRYPRASSKGSTSEAYCWDCKLYQTRIRNQ
eukprot:892853-Amphidinium_carterae.1